MVALVADAELPPKIGVHPRPDGSFGHAMPAYLRGADTGGRRRPGRDEVGDRVRGQTGLAACRRSTRSWSSTTRPPGDRSRSWTAVRSPRSGPQPSPAWRSGASRRRVAGRPVRVVIIGAGVQGHSHLPVLAHVLPGVHLIVADRHPDRAVELADLAIATPGIGSATAVDATEVRDATRAADIVVTAAAFGPVRQVMTEDWLGPNTHGRCRRLRHLLLRRGRPSSGPLPRRPARAVPGQPRRRPVRGLPGPRRDARRGDPRPQIPSRDGSRGRDTPGCRSGRCHLRDGRRAPGRGARARDAPARDPLRRRRHRGRGHGRLDRARRPAGGPRHAPYRCVRCRSSARDIGRRDPDHPLVSWR